MTPGLWWLHFTRCAAGGLCLGATAGGIYLAQPAGCAWGAAWCAAVALAAAVVWLLAVWEIEKG